MECKGPPSSTSTNNNAHMKFPTTNTTPIQVLRTTSSSVTTSLLFFLLLNLNLLSNTYTVVSASAIGIPCTTTAECTEKLRPGSICNSDNVCTNPLIGGCLQYESNYPGTYGYEKGQESNTPANIDSEDEQTGDEESNNTSTSNATQTAIEKYIKGKKRSCNSEDPPNAHERGLCSEPNPFFNYTEIRIMSGNWESAVFFGWVMQILLSEVLQIPTTLINGHPNHSISFYNEHNEFQFPSVANPWEGFQRANSLQGDCSQVAKEEYCGHVMNEVWRFIPDKYAGIAELGHTGIIGANGWFIPTFTLEKYPFLSSYIGIKEAGEKLAEIFKRPTTWKKYCDEVSTDMCATDDGVATRYPAAPDEEDSYFSRDNYIGHFAYTEKNNCTNPDIQCTGHLVDYPCTWQSYFERQVYWNDMKLDNDIEYTYGEMKQIFEASNATKSDIIITWWYPEPTIADGFQRVTLPRVTSECLKGRQMNFDINDRCKGRDEILQGTKEEACDNPHQSVKKYFAKSFIELSVNSSKVEKNPAYDFLASFKSRVTDVMEMLEAYMARGEHRNAFDARDVVCEWVVQNFDEGAKLSKFLPPDYPLELAPKDGPSYNIAPIIVGSLSACLAISIMVAIYLLNEREMIEYSQPPFLYQLCVGYLFVSIAALLYGIEPSTASCMALEWFELLGYTTIIVPVYLKTSAINAARQSDRRRGGERVRIIASERKLSQTSVILLLICIIYMICWTTLDPSTKKENAILVEGGEHAGKVKVQTTCYASSQTWGLFTDMWMGACVICSFILITQSDSNTRTLFDELMHIRFVVYAILLFFIAQMIAVYVPDIISSDPKVHDTLTSVILSLHATVCLSFYFAPKFWKLYKEQDVEELMESIVLVSRNSVNLGSSFSGSDEGRRGSTHMRATLTPNQSLITTTMQSARFSSRLSSRLSILSGASNRSSANMGDVFLNTEAEVKQLICKDCAAKRQRESWLNKNSIHEIMQELRISEGRESEERNSSSLARESDWKTSSKSIVSGTKESQDKKPSSLLAQGSERKDSSQLLEVQKSDGDNLSN